MDQFCSSLELFMRKKISPQALPLAIALAASLSIASIAPAQANGFTADTSKLPDASKIHRAPLQFQIIDNNPKVTDTRQPQENTIYQINVPPMPQSTTNVMQIGGPVQAPGNRPNNSNTVPILQNSLPFAGSHSNISPHQPMANPLPIGTSTQGLHGILAKKQAQPTPMAQSAPTAKPLSAASRPTPTGTATYAPTTPSVRVNQSTSTNTHVVGSLLHPKKDK
jgi:hypothetical protein